MKKLKQLVQMLHEKDPDVLVTVRKLVMVSLMEVFKDIVPGYHLRQPTEQEQKQKVRKINPYLMNGFSHRYQLGESTFIFRGVRSEF